MPASWKNPCEGMWRQLAQYLTANTSQTPRTLAAAPNMSMGQYLVPCPSRAASVPKRVVLAAPPNMRMRQYLLPCLSNAAPVKKDSY